MLKLIEIVILWVYYTIPFGFSLFWHFRASLLNVWNYFVWLRITDEGSVPEMRIWSILLTISGLKWCIHLSRSLFIWKTKLSDKQARLSRISTECFTKSTYRSDKWMTYICHHIANKTFNFYIFTFIYIFYTLVGYCFKEFNVFNIRKKWSVYQEYEINFLEYNLLQTFPLAYDSDWPRRHDFLTCIILGISVKCKTYLS